MSRLIDIDDERFWDVLFDEACVEGNQAERIKNELDKIVAFDTEKVVSELEQAKGEISLYGDDLDIYCNGLDTAIDIVKRGGIE